MKKILLVSLLVSTNILLFAQDVILDVTSPIQRIGENLTIHYEITPTAFQIETKSNEKPVPETCKTPDYSIGKGSFRLTQKLDTTGTYTIGPFSFNVEGKSYKSSTLTLNIFPELPKSTSGLWLNYVNFNKKHFFVIEHRVEGRHITRPDYTNLRKKDTVFVALKDSIFNDEIMGIISKKYTSKTSKIENKWYTQKTYIYELWLANSYKNDFLIDEKHLINLPSTTKVEAVLIKK